MVVQTRKQREFHRREEEILQASLCLFNQDNLQSVTVDRIAEVAEIGKGTVYKHFSSKEDIYASLYLNFCEGLIHEIMQVNPDQSADAILRDSIEAALRYHLDHSEYRRVTQFCKNVDFRRKTSDKYRIRLEDMDNRFRTLTSDLLRDSIAAGVIPNASFQQMVYGIFTCFEGAIYYLCNSELLDEFLGEKLDINTYISTISRFILSGLKGLR